MTTVLDHRRFNFKMLVNQTTLALKFATVARVKNMKVRNFLNGVENVNRNKWHSLGYSLFPIFQITTNIVHMTK